MVCNFDKNSATHTGTRFIYDAVADKDLENQ